MDQAHIYDMIILGGGPGGYTAALYAARAGLDVVVLEKLSAGGQMAQSHQIDNYPGFEDGIDGFELGEKMQLHAQRFGARTEYAEATAVTLDAAIKTVQTSEGTFRGRTVVLATGASPRKLGIPDEERLIGKGIAYCAACDGMFYRGKTVVVVGGGNSAVADAQLLSRIAKEVILVHRKDTLRATKVYHEQLKSASNITILWNSALTGLRHDGKVTGAVIRNLQNDTERTVDCDGVFISIGRVPATSLFESQVDLDEAGYVMAGETTETNLPGVFAVGDLRSKPMRQIITAAADGAVAAEMAERYLAAAHESL